MANFQLRHGECSVEDIVECVAMVPISKVLPDDFT